MTEQVSSIRVVHVDDDPSLAEMVATFLERVDERLSIETETSASDGLERLAERHVDCIVSDYEMPGLNGLEFLETVRDQYPDLPFILYTGKGSEEVASEAIATGVTDYLQKDTGSEQYQLLANRIRNAVDQYRSRTNYRELFRKVPDGVVVHDPADGSFVEMNDQYAELFGYEREELLEADFDAVVPEESPYAADQARHKIREVVDSGPQTFEWPGLECDSEQFWAEVHLAPVTLDGRQRVLAIVRDVTDRKERERTLTTLTETFDELETSESTDEVCQQTVTTAEELFDADLSQVVIEEDGTVQVRAASESSPRAETTLSVDQGVVREAHRTGEPIRTDDADADAVELQGPYRSGICYPVGDHGYLRAVAKRPDAFTERDVEAAELLVDRAAVALDRLSTD